MIVVTKRCGRCQRELPLAAFGKNRSRPDDLQDRCIECRSTAHAERMTDPAKRQEHNMQGLASYHGLDEEGKAGRWSRGYERRAGVRREERAAVLAAQGGRCAICRKEITDDSDSMLDHNHRCCPTKKMCGLCLRGVLCKRCNWGLGMLGDDPVILRAAADYVEASGTTATLAAAISRLDALPGDNAAILGHLRAVLSGPVS